MSAITTLELSGNSPQHIAVARLTIPIAAPKDLTDLRIHIFVTYEVLKLARFGRDFIIAGA
jgi:hypothetical protein